MKKDWDQQDGVLIQAIPYLGNHRILKIFTKDAGLLTLIAKNIKTQTAAVTTPFCKAEWVYRKSNGEIYSFKEATLLDSLEELRKTYEIITAASSIARDLLRSQLPHRSSHELYELLIATYQHLPRNPSAIALSFRLKLLQYEGLIRPQNHCARCQRKATNLFRGESFCENHIAMGSIVFDDNEWQQLLILSLGRRFSEFTPIQPQTSFINKIEQLFSERIH